MSASSTSPWTVWAFLALAGIASTGCSDLTAGGFGDVYVYASGDGSSLGGPVGEVDVNFIAFLIGDDGQGFQLGASELHGELAIDGSTEQLLQIQLTPEGRYTEVVFYFVSVAANVVTGLPVSGDLTVALPAPVRVARPIDLDLDEDDVVELVIDLNAPAWLATADPITMTVQEAAFSAPVDVSLR